MKDVCYKKNYLVEVVARLDFAKPIDALMGAVLPERVQTAIKKQYSIYEPNKITKHGVSINNDVVSAHHREEMHEWIYHGENREKTIKVSAHTVVVTFKVYKDFDEFKANIVTPIKEIINLEKNIQIRRTGLRFVNIYTEIASSFSGLSKYFHPMLTCSFDNLIDSNSCSRNFLVSEYLYDEIKLRMQTGIYNPDYPAKIKKMDFIVDLDAYIDTPHVVSDFEEFFDEIHEKIQDKFEMSITEDLREVLDER